MYENDDEFLAALAPDALRGSAEGVVKLFKQTHPGEVATRKALNIFFEKEFGPAVIRTHSFDYDRDLYLIPVHRDDVPVLDTTTPPNLCRILPVRSNAQLLPLASKLQQRIYNLPDFKLSVADAREGLPDEAKNEVESLARAQAFTFDVVGEEVAAEETATVEGDSTNRTSEGGTFDVKSYIDTVKVEDKADLKKLVHQYYGTSVEATTQSSGTLENGAREKVKTAAYSALCQPESKTEDFLLKVIADTSHARKIATSSALEPQIQDEKKLRKQSLRELRHNQIDGWFGMKRRKITEYDRREFQAIDLRGYVDPKRRYRTSSGKSLALAKADDGFYQFGTVIGGQGDVRVGEETKLGTTSKRRIPTLVRSILQA